MPAIPLVASDVSSCCSTQKSINQFSGSPGAPFSCLAYIVACLCLAASSASTSFAQPFTVSQFRPWAGYAIPNGIWLTGDFNADGRQDIVHAVSGADYVNVWTSDGAGGFAVTSFRPWAGYAIPNGLWLTGDFNGDGKTDIVHAVANTDYVNVWTSNGGGTFSVTSFSPWSGYAIPNGVWRTGDFNRDGRTDIFHAVAGTDYANVWLSDGKGRFNVSSFRPWAGYAIPNGEWLTGDFNGDGRTDIFHAVAGADYANVWTAGGSGGFSVASFRPWSGYAIPNGVWLAADYDGDGLTDVFHAVASGDYAHVWTSRGAAGFSVSTFRPWAGYAIPNGLWMTGDFDHDGRSDVLHAVDGTDYVNIWRSNGTASFNVSSFSPWSGYAIPNGLWLPADITGDGRTDIVHAVQNTDYVHPWISNLPSPKPANAQVVVEGIEVTQAIQDLAQSVVLVANRATIARVYLGIGGTSSVTLTGVLTVANPTTGATATVNALTPITVNPAQNGQLQPKREQLNDALTFSIPASFTVVGARQLTLTSVSNSASGSAIGCTNCTAASRVAPFVNASALRLRMVGLQYQTGTPPAVVNNAPASADFALLQSWLLRAYPVDQVLASQTTVASTSAWPFACGTANAQLAAIRANDISSSAIDVRTHYYGLVSNGGGYMRGCSSGVPSAADPTVVASGPTGSPTVGAVPVNVAGDVDASFGDWYGGHEIAHTFGRAHPGFCNGNSADDSSFPYPNGQLSPNSGSFTGLDIGDTGNAIPRTMLPGATRFDIMTYCNQPQWLSAYNYQAIRARLDVEDTAFPSAPGPGPAGARLHKTNLTTPSAGCPCEELVAPSLKVAPRPVVGMSAPSSVTFGREAPLPIPAAARTKPRLADAKPYPSPPRPRLAAPPRPHYGVLRPSAETQPATEPPPQVELRSGRYVSIVAVVNLSKNTAKIAHVYPIERALVPVATRSDRAVLRVTNASGRVLGEYRVWIREDTDIPPGEDRTAVIDAVIRYDKATAKVELLLSGKVADVLRVSGHAPELKGLRSSRVVQNERAAMLLEWEGRDQDGDTLSYLVQTSSDGGKTWETVGIGLRDPRLILPLAPLRGGKAHARVIANDGWHNSKPMILTVTPEPRSKP